MNKKQEKEILIKIGATIKKKREEAGLSLRELSAKTNIDFSNIAKVEKGEINITILTLVQLAASLELTLSDFDSVDP